MAVPFRFPLPSKVDVVVVGGGPAGIGVAVALRAAGVDDVLVLERGAIGESFRKWPTEARTQCRPRNFHCDILLVPN